MKRATHVLLSIFAVFMAGCKEKPKSADAYGNFEAVKVRVSAEAAGRLLDFVVKEGDRLAAGQVVGSVEATPLELERAQVVASRTASATRIVSVEAQLAVLAEQKRLAGVELARLRRLAADQAATPQQLEKGKSEVAVLERQIRQVGSQRTTIGADLAAFDAQLARIDDKIARAPIRNPIAGTVLTRYVEASELVAAGQPLYDLADLSSLELRAYVSGAQLPQLKLGQEVAVAIDDGVKSDRTLRGVVSWIAPQAEFTPSTVQTKEERVDLVYAFKVRVQNPEGRIKIGMPGEVRFAPQAGAPGSRP